MMQTTSLEAQLSLSLDLKQTMRDRVRYEIWRAGAVEGITGLIDEEIQERLDMNPSTERPRRQELLQAGFIEDSLLRRKTKSGRNAIIWRVKR